MTNEESIIFAIDDIEENLGVLTNILMEENYKVYFFTNPKEALPALKQLKPHLILLDIMMPEMNGYEVCQILKNDPQTKDIPVIFLTAKNEAEDIVGAFQVGGVDYITKPFKKEELLARVKTHITLNLTEKSLRDTLDEKEMILNETLKGSIKVMIEILSVINQELFSQTLRVRNLAKKIIERLKIKNVWEIEMGILLSQIGCAAIPPDIIKKRFSGYALSSDETILFFSHPKIGEKFIQTIPMLKGIAENIGSQFSNYSPEGGDKFLIRDFIKMLFEYDYLIHSGKTQQQALELMESKIERYNPVLYRALEAEIKHLMMGFIVKAIPLEELKIGMVLVEDIRSEKDISLIPKNSEISDIILQRILNFKKFEMIYEPIKILDPIN